MFLARSALPLAGRRHSKRSAEFSGLAARAKSRFGNCGRKRHEAFGVRGLIASLSLVTMCHSVSFGAGSSLVVA